MPRSILAHPGGGRVPLRGSLILALLLLTFGACTTTRFPDSPEEHRLYRELQAAGHEYYFNVRAGVMSRVLAIQPEEAMREDLDEVQRLWGDIDRLGEADEVIEYLQDNGLELVADRIGQTLRANEGDAPPGGADARIEAIAVKQGLVDAVFESREG